MTQTAIEEAVQTLFIERHVEIAAPVRLVYESTLAQIGPESDTPDGTPMPMVLEPWPGGRWFRDLGDKAGHLWGHVQVIKPPNLIEICGPLFMSYPAISHVQYRLTAQGDRRTLLKITHRAMGLIPADHREGVKHGWEHELTRIRAAAERRARA